MFLIAENLQHTISTLSSVSEPIYMGGVMTRPPKHKTTYCGGGAGYTLNRAALMVLIKSFETCWPHHASSDEDRIVGECFGERNIRCQHNTDEKDETRYHPLHAQYHVRWVRVLAAPWYPDILQERFNITATNKERSDGISSTTVTFHLIDGWNMTKTPHGLTPPSIFGDNGMRRYHAIVYGLCDEYDKK